MTLAFAGILMTAASVLGTFAVDLGAAASDKARAQIAADAAALAAAAESAPGGGRQPEAQARRFAAANSADLLECSCEAGATAMQVRVRYGDVVADARATFDPKFLAPGAVVGTSELHPLLADAVDRLIRAANGRVRIESAVRSYEEQTRLWDAAVARYGSAEAADDWVAPPGHSMHEAGLAVDLAGDIALAASLVAGMGLPMHRPLGHEPWHFELVGSRR